MKNIWKQEVTIEELNDFSKNSAETLGSAASSIAVDDQEQLTCISRLTMAVLKAK